MKQKRGWSDEIERGKRKRMKDKRDVETPFLQMEIKGSARTAIDLSGKCTFAMMVNIRLPKGENFPPLFKANLLN